MSTALNKTATQFQSKVAAELWFNINGREFRLVGRVIRIGRAADNDIVLDDKSVSRYHAILTILPDQVILEDLKSRNGSSVNGSKIKRAELKDNDHVHIGDLPGIFFQKQKTGSTKQGTGPELKNFHVEVSKVVSRVQELKVKFEGLSKGRKLGLIGAGIFTLFIFMILLSAGNAPAPAPEAVASEPEREIIQTAVDRRSFERCQELEDLGNFRQAGTCFKGLPNTAEVHNAIERVKKTQAELTEKRYLEGEQAFRNYYYDIAIQKWQEVLLVADDESKFMAEAMRGIQEAEVRKRQK